MKTSISLPKTLRKAIFLLAIALAATALQVQLNLSGGTQVLTCEKLLPLILKQNNISRMYEYQHIKTSLLNSIHIII
jgi:hypothetical protein